LSSRGFLFPRQRAGTVVAGADHADMPISLRWSAPRDRLGGVAAAPDGPACGCHFSEVGKRPERPPGLGLQESADVFGAEPRQRVVESNKQAIAELVGEAGLNLVPVVGGSIVAAWTRVVGAAYEQRRERWEAELVEAVNDLIDRVDWLTPRSLAQNDTFLDAVAHATTIAASTGQQEKLNALRNAVLNAALPGDIDADMQAMFLRHVGDLTPAHLRALKLLADVSSHRRRTPTAYMPLFEQHIAKFRSGAREFYEQLDRDLSAAGLIRANTLMSTFDTTKKEWVGCPSRRGTNFVDWIGLSPVHHRPTRQPQNRRRPAPIAGAGR
jgi:hypothetical protein